MEENIKGLIKEDYEYILNQAKKELKSNSFKVKISINELIDKYNTQHIYSSQGKIPFEDYVFNCNYYGQLLIDRIPELVKKKKKGTGESIYFIFDEKTTIINYDSKLKEVLFYIDLDKAIRIYKNDTPVKSDKGGLFSNWFKNKLI